MTAYALDYSAGRPAGDTVRAAGYAGAIRYIGFDPASRPKCVTAAEYRSLTAAGRGVALVYENQPGDALAGHAAGRTAATRARAWADRIGFPKNRPIYMACDTDVVSAAQFASVLDYLRGAGDVLGGPSRVGVYGEYDVIERAAGAGVAKWFWQTKAWSRGRVSPRAHLLQLIGTAYVGGVPCDRNEIRATDWGQTGAGSKPEEDTDMPLTPADVDLIWNEPVPWPAGVDLPHGKPTYSLREWIVGANIGAAKALAAAGDLHQTVATLAAQVGALTALIKTSGGLDAAQLHQVALDAAKEALDGVTVTTTVHEGAPE